MNRQICEKEDQTLEAVFGGSPDTATISHAQQCHTCSDILLVAGLMQEEGTLTGRERTAVPDPAPIWREARSRASQEVIRLALRPIRVMKIVACVAFACAPWLRLVFPIGKELSTSWSRTLDSSVSLFSKTSLSNSAEVVVVLVFSSTLILLGISSWCMLQQE